MFELPSAKRVNRNELQSPVSSLRSSPDPAFTELLRSQLDEDYTFIAHENETTEGGDPAGEDAEETELILFAAPATSTPQTHKVRLSSPDAVGGEPGFTVKRPRSYYFADDVTSEKKAEYEAAAVDGKTVVQLAHEKWPGCALPWKVTTISSAGMKKAVLVGHPKCLVTVEEGVSKRQRKGKKSRIALRKKLQAVKEKNTEKARLALEKEEAEREKRTRRNREKKVKKKAREKAKKLAGTEDGDVGQAAAQDSEDIPTE